MMVAACVFTVSTQPLGAACGSVMLTTQDQVDVFSCDGVVTGSLIIQDDGSVPMTNLNGLSPLSSAGKLIVVLTNPLLDRF